MTNKLDAQWQVIQQKVFTKWCNMHLGKQGEKIENLQTDFNDGIKLIRLLEVISAETLGKFNKNPKMKIHKIQNVNKALEFIAAKGVKLWGISSEDIVDENLKLILGMIWTIILRFAIADISEEELNAKEALLLWAKKKTAGYNNVKVENFTNSWADGLAFCALIHAHRPDLLDFDSLDKNKPHENAQLAFDIAERELGITKLLDVEDLVDVPKPDERSVMTYVAEFYHVFSANRKNEIAGRRIGKLVDLTRANDQLKHDYETRAGEHTKWVKDATSKMEERDFGNSLEEIKKLIADLNTFKTEEKPPKAADRLGLESLHNTIQVKLSSSGHPAYVPPEGLTVKDIADRWDELEKAQQAREEALLAELARQQMLDLLARRFNNKASQLEDWIQTQQDSLNEEDNITNLEVAEQKLKALEAFKQEYEQNKARLQELHGIKDEYCNADGKDKVAITDRAEKIQRDFDGLNDLVNQKSARLQEQLGRQQQMEELRKKFANAVKEYNLWVKDTVGDVSSTAFPDSLEGVEQYKSQLDQEDSDITSSNDSKKKNLDDLWEQEQQMGITNNPYTVFTNEDIAALHSKVGEALKERQSAYQTELERQKLNEEKRKQFAQEAQNFVDQLDSRTKEIDALEGEPEELIEKINSTYADGQPEADKLQSLSSMQEEMAQMGIMENRHTPYTLPILKVNNDNLARYVRNRIAALGDEDRLKKEYNQKSRSLLEWMNTNQPNIRSEFDNTLEGARALKEKWTTYKTTERAQKGLDRINLQSLYKTIQNNQQANNRPEFVPIDDLKIENISSRWEEMSAEEKKWEDELNEELTRQENIQMQVKFFESEADELQKKIDAHDSFLGQEDAINSLDESRMKLMTMDVFDEDVQNSGKRLDAIKSRAENIKALNYNKQSEIDERVTQLEGRLNSIRENASSKRDAVKAENDVQEKKEALRVDFAQKVNAYAQFVREAKADLENRNFGTTLEAVEQTAAKLDENDKSLLEQSSTQRDAITAADGELKSNNITENPHTDKSVEDVNKMGDELQQAIDERRSAYEKELATQKEYDAERKSWAEKAQSFVDYLEEVKTSIKGVEGTPEEKTQKVKDTFKEGADAQQRLEELNNSNTEMRAKGIYSNQYTPYTIQALQKRLQQLTNTVNNSISFFDEEEEFNQREQENEKKWQEKQELEQRRLDFEFKCKNLIMYLDSLQDVLTDPINVTTVAAAENLQKEFSDTVSELQGKQSEYDEIQQQQNDLQSQGVSVSIDVTKSKWEQTQSNVESRQAVLNDTLEKQKEIDALCKQFADKAAEADQWLTETSNTLASDSGDLESQLAAIRSLNVEPGRQFVDELSEMANKLAAEDVRVNPYTDKNVPSIRVRVNELESSKKSKEAVIEKEMLAKKNSTASPEQIAEFKEVFAHFDKNHTNTLNTSEFKSCLQSLGEDPTDDQMENLMQQLGDVVDNNGEQSRQIGFEKFLDYCIKITSDTTTEKEISDAFRELAGDKDYITEEDLRRSGMENEKVNYLLGEMPAKEGVEGGYDYLKWASSAFSR